LHRFQKAFPEAQRQPSLAEVRQKISPEHWTVTAVSGGMVPKGRSGTVTPIFNICK
jgi:hypothetical protein